MAQRRKIIKILTRLLPSAVMIILLWITLISLPQLTVNKLWSLIFTILAGLAGQYLPKKIWDDQIRRITKRWLNQRAIRRKVKAEEKAKRSRIESAEAIKEAAEAAFDECTENPPLIPPCIIERSDKNISCRLW